MQPRIVFMGTPEFAVPALRVLAERFPAESVLVVTQPDRAAGRGRKMQAPPVKIAATELGLEVLQISSFRDEGVREQLSRFAPDLIVVAAFGRILPRWVLALPTRGCVNIHASLLPRFRGASPVSAAIACGDERAGVALMEMEPGLDTGPVYAIRSVEVEPDETTERLTARLAALGAEMLDAAVLELLEGTLVAEAQHGAVVETRKIEKQHGRIDWNRGAAELERHVRAMWPWPRAWTVAASGERLQVHRTEVADGGSGREATAGTILRHDERGVLVQTGDGALRLLTIQLPGKPARAAVDLAQHPALADGTVLGAGADAERPEAWIVPASSND